MNDSVGGWCYRLEQSIPVFSELGDSAGFANKSIEAGLQNCPSFLCYLVTSTPPCLLYKVPKQMGNGGETGPKGSHSLGQPELIRLSQTGEMASACPEMFLSPTKM